MSTEAADHAPTAVDFDTDRRWRLHRRVALRPEPFGAMAYHYGNRRLTFLRSPELVALVERLDEFVNADRALATVPAHRRPAFTRALVRLAAGDFLEPADA